MMPTSRVDSASRPSHNLFVSVLADCNSDSNVNGQNLTWIRAQTIRYGICVFDVVVILICIQGSPVLLLKRGLRLALSCIMVQFEFIALHNKNAALFFVDYLARSYCIGVLRLLCTT